MIALFWRTLRDRKNSIIIFTAVSVGLILMYTALFPTVKKQADQMQSLLKAYPKSMLKAFNMEDVFFSNYESYMSTEEFSLMWPILLFCMMIAWGGSAIAGEIDQGTMKFLLSQPISRPKIFFAKYIAGLKALGVYVVLTIASCPLFAKLFDFDVELANYLKLAIVGFLLGWAIFSIAIFFSSIFSDKGKSYFITAGILVLMYAANIASTLKENISDLKYISFFYYYNPAQTLAHGKIEDLAYWIFIGVSIIFTLAGVLWFSKRDVAN